MAYEIEEVELLFEDLEERIRKSVNQYVDELSVMRAGRANAHILDGVTVDYYGTETPLNQIANISVPEARMLVIAPWDANLLKKLEKAIFDANIGITPNNDGKVIRLIFPEPTEERRRALVKDVKNNTEKCKVAIRNIRRDIISELKILEKNKVLNEDYRVDLEKKVDKQVEIKIGEVDKLARDKETEIMKV